MDGDRQIEQEIASLLAVEPSPEFLARVRTRVAQEPEPGPWRWSWMLATAGAATLVIVAVMVGPPRDSAPSNDASEKSAQVSGTVETVTPPALSPEPALGRPTRPRAVAVAALSDRATDIDLPEVMVADNEKSAFATLVTSIRQRRFDVAVPTAPDPDTPLEVKDLPPVEPLEIEPIVRMAALQTEGERP